MAKKSLYPVFDVPELVTKEQTADTEYKQSVYFDFETGDFRLDGANRMTKATGQEAYEQWCRKVVSTERYSFLAYSTDIGTEMIDAFSLGNRSAIESAVERTIKETLMVNPKTEYVSNFSFEWEGDNMYCEFTVKGKDTATITMNTIITA